jgi:hypothetical protein
MAQANSEDRSQEQEIQKWEYKVTPLTEIKGHTQESLNTLGEDGWELVATHGELGHRGTVYILKRRKK